MRSATATAWRRSTSSTTSRSRPSSPRPTRSAAPLIVQTSVKTVAVDRAAVLYAMWRRDGRDSPRSRLRLHLDHCPDRAVISACLALGWNSVLFDALRG